MLPDPYERGRRRRVVATAAVTVLLLAVVALKVTSMQIAQKVGADAWRSGDGTAAERWFALTDRLNLVERWVAPYNRGVAAHTRKEWSEAAARFEQALSVAPASVECRIALNWTWTLEAAGDELAEQGDAQGTHARWAEAAGVLAEAGGCDEDASSESPSSPSSQPADDSSEGDPEEGGETGERGDSEQGQVDQTKERLDQKRQVGEQDPKDGPEDQGSDDRADQLAERNRQGAREKQRSEDDSGTRKPDDGNDRTW